MCFCCYFSQKRTHKSFVIACARGYLCRYNEHMTNWNRFLGNSVRTKKIKNQLKPFGVVAFRLSHGVGRKLNRTNEEYKWRVHMIVNEFYFEPGPLQRTKFHNCKTEQNRKPFHAKQLTPLRHLHLRCSVLWLQKIDVQLQKI